jgi:hypothetical protein
VPSSLRPERHRWSALAALVAVLALILAACSGGRDDSSSSQRQSSEAAADSAATTSGDGAARNVSTEPIGAEAAIGEYLRTQGHEYVGDCGDTRLPRDKGKWCSTMQSSDTNAGTETYEVGPVGETPEKTITVKRRGAAALTPGYSVGVTDGNVGDTRLLTRQELEADTFITGNLVLDQQAGIGAGIADLPAGAPSGGTGGTGGDGGGGGGGTLPPVTTPDGGTAQYPPTGGIVIDDPTVGVGGEVAFRGSGCLPSESLQVLFDGQPIGTVGSDATGRFAGTIGIPRGTAPGTHRLTVQGTGCVFNTTITVVGSSLAFTGSSSHTGTYVFAGIAAVVVGFVFVVGSRRRRRVLGRRSVSGQ